MGCDGCEIGERFTLGEHRCCYWLYGVYGPDGEINLREDLIGFVVAAVIVLIGWWLRYILAGRSTRDVGELSRIT
jgi:hypothetical protein